MNGHKVWKRVVTLLALLSFVVASLEGFIYYGRYEEFGLFRIFLTLQNSFQAFLFVPSLSAETVLQDLSQGGSTGELYIGLAYVAAAFIAPLCTATAAFVAIEKFFRRQVRQWKIRRSEGILIFGYNETVKLLLQGQRALAASDHSIVHIVTNLQLSEKEELALMKANIYLRRLDCAYASKEELRHMLQEVGSPRIRKIFLLEDSSMRNVSLYFQLSELTQDQAQPVFHPEAICCCCCTEFYARELAQDYFDRKHPPLDLHLFDLAEVRVRRTLERCPLFGNRFSTPLDPDSSLPTQRYDIHVLIVGFGDVGEQFLRQTINTGVAHADSTILIDVVDQCAQHRKKVFCNALQLEELEESENEICIGGTDATRAAADGLLRIRFHQMDTTESDFIRLFQTISREMPVNYAAICIKDLDVAVRCVSAIERCINQTQPFPVAVKLEGGEQLAEYLDQNDTTYSNVYAVGGISQQGALALDEILDPQTEQTARSYHQIYRTIHFGLPQEDATIGPDWDELNYYQQRANRLLCWHNHTKEYILRTADPREPAVTLREHLTQAGIDVAYQNYTYDSSEEELLQRLEQDPVLNQMMRLEHRRWCYAMLFDGWSGNCSKKNEALKQTPYLCKWDVLAPHVKKYDLMPALMLTQSWNRTS